MALQLPKEHGSWGMFYIPLVLGFLIAGAFGAPGALFLVAATAFFLAREPFMAFWRKRRRRVADGVRPIQLIACVVIATLAGAPLLFVFERVWLAPFVLFAAFVLVWHAEAAMKGRGRSLAAETIAIAASTLTAPAAYYTATGGFDTVAIILWALCTAYFLSSVFYVKMRLTAAHARDTGTPARTRMQCAVYHAGLALALLVLATSGTIPVIAALAFAPVCTRAFAGILQPSRELNLKRVGWAEVAYSLVFLGLVAAAL
jgi:hypothetical protein